MALIGDEVGIVAVHQFIAMVAGFFGWLGHRTSPHQELLMTWSRRLADQEK
jgi:hypothetical protein